MLSLILIGRDVSAYVAACLTSISRSDFTDYEVVFVDDASVDGTSDLVESFRPSLPSLTLVRHETATGLAGARNSGLRKARGEVISFLDADDWIGPHVLRVMSEAVVASGADFVRVDHVRVTGRDRVVHRAPEFRRGVVLSPRDTIGPPGRESMVDYPYTCMGAFTRALLDRGLLDQNPQLETAEDRPWIWRLHLRTDSFVMLTIAEHFYRRGLPSSLSQVGDARQLHYLTAYAEVLALVRDDAESAIFLPKALEQFVAVSVSHLDREDRLEPSLRAWHRAELASFVAREQVVETIEPIKERTRERVERLAALVHDYAQGA